MWWLSLSEQAALGKCEDFYSEFVNLAASFVVKQVGFFKFSLIIRILGNSKQ